MVNIEINGKPVQAEDGAMLIEVADANGVTIPRFCYHSKLSIAANCRMCLVEVEKAPKPMPACATPVTDGMKVYTRSPKAIAAQRAVLEFLLINHPLDCPICDQGGECDLQEMAVGFGGDVSRFSEGKRVVPSKNIGPLIATDMTRCIHCTRCVRFGQEIAGVMELGAVGRGEHTRIGTYVENTVDSELSGNVADLCPVGALTSKPYRYTARPWEMAVRETVSPHDCVGANMRVDIRNNQVMRALPRDNEEVNEIWLADRERYAYTALYHDERLTKPMIRKDGNWQETDWDTALTFAAEGLKSVIVSNGADSVGAIGAPWQSVEELYLLQKLMRGIGSGNVDHRIGQQDFSDDANAPIFPWLGQAIADLENTDATVIVGGNLRHEQPLINHRLRKAVMNNDAFVGAVNPVDFEFNYPVTEAIDGDLVGLTAALVVAIAEQKGSDAPAEAKSLQGSVVVSDELKHMAAKLVENANATVLLGTLAVRHAQRAQLQWLVAKAAELAGVRVGILPEGGNSAGAWLAGCVPHRGVGGKALAATGKDWLAMAQNGLKGLVVLGAEISDCIDPVAGTQLLANADFVVALSAFRDDAVKANANVLLPIALYPESAGTYVNVEGRWQSVNGCVPPPGDARPAWKLLRVMGNLLEVSGFEYMAADDVLADMKKDCDGIEPAAVTASGSPGSRVEVTGLRAIGDMPIYLTDPMVRRAAPLQETRLAALSTAVRVSSDTLQQANVSGEHVTVAVGDAEATLPLTVDEGIPAGCVYIPAGMGVGISGTVTLKSA